MIGGVKKGGLEWEETSTARLTQYEGFNRDLKRKTPRGSYEYTLKFSAGPQSKTIWSSYSVLNF